MLLGSVRQVSSGLCRADKGLRDLLAESLGKGRKGHIELSASVVDEEQQNYEVEIDNSGSCFLQLN